MKLCFIDTETTGLFPVAGDRICEIALISVNDQLEEIGSFQTLINPERDISPEAYQVNRIEKAELIDAPLFRDISDSVSEFIDGNILIGHNIAFDYDFIVNDFSIAGNEVKPEKLLDTRLIARALVNSASYGLSSLTQKFGIEIKDRHRAMGDCRATHELFCKLLSVYSSDRNTSVREIITNFSSDPGKLVEECPQWLREALDNNYEVKIEYLSRNSKNTKRVILPMRVYENRGKLYLEAICRLRNSKRTFLIERVVKAELSSGQF